MEFRALPHQRTLALANKGEIDGDVARVPSIVNKYQNLRKIDEKLIALRGVAYTSLKEVTSYNDALLDNNVIGRVRGIYWSEEKLNTYSSVGVNTYPQMFKMLANKRLGIVLATEASGDDVVKEMGESASGIVKLEPPIFSTDLHHYVHKKNISIIPKLETAIKSIRREGFWTK
ncbi:hypothetical protein [Kiloniella sp.]|uniref:hypothetical protein n=1 Tax=Kiloniella sp. TaxID=1938587 RepID=UPI003B02B21D